jgi:hypothetical protein
MSKISKTYFFRKIEIFFLKIQEFFCISANMCQRCQGSKVVYTCLIAAENQLFGPQYEGRYWFKSWYVTTISLDFTCFFSGGRPPIRSFPFDPIKLRLTGATLYPPKCRPHVFEGTYMPWPWRTHSTSSYFLTPGRPPTLFHTSKCVRINVRWTWFGGCA